MSQEDKRSLAMIQATIRYVAALQEEAEGYGLDLGEFLQVVRSAYLAAPGATALKGT